MQKHQDVIFKPDGSAFSGISVRVQTYPAGVDAVLFSDNGLTALPNPLTTDEFGAFAFYAANDRYQLVITSSSIESTRTVTDILLYDPADGGGSLGEIVIVPVVLEGATTPGVMSGSGTFIYVRNGFVITFGLFFSGSSTGTGQMVFKGLVDECNAASVFPVWVNGTIYTKAMVFGSMAGFDLYIYQNDPGDVVQIPVDMPAGSFQIQCSGSYVSDPTP